MDKRAGILLIIVTLTLGTSACENRDAERGQFNNNSSGADRDKTIVAKDTVSTTGLTVDSVSASDNSGGMPTQ